MTSCLKTYSHTNPDTFRPTGIQYREVDASDSDAYKTAMSGTDDWAPVVSHKMGCTFIHRYNEDGHPLAISDELVIGPCMIRGVAGKGGRLMTSMIEDGIGMENVLLGIAHVLEARGCGFEPVITRIDFDGDVQWSLHVK